MATNDGTPDHRADSDPIGEAVGHEFDQTNGLAGDLDGDEDTRTPEDGVDPHGEVLLDPTFSDEERHDRPDEDERVV